MLAFQFHIQNQAYLSDDSKKKVKQARLQGGITLKTSELWKLGIKRDLQTF